jgi:hypothetical protein
VAYQSDVTGRFEVYVRALEGGPARQASTNGGRLPRWNERGGELFFVDGESRLMRLPVAASGEFDRTQAEPLFQFDDALDYEPYVDGTRFLVRLPTKTAPPIGIITDWRALVGESE